MDYLKYYNVDYSSLKSTGSTTTIDHYIIDSNVMFCAELSFLILVPIILLFISHHLHQIVKELKNARKSSDSSSKGASSQN